MSVKLMSAVFEADCTWPEIDVNPAVIKCVLLGICECGVFHPYTVFVGHVSYLTDATYKEIDAVVSAAIERGVIDRLSLTLNANRLDRHPIPTVKDQITAQEAEEQSSYISQEEFTDIQKRAKAITAERSRLRPRVRYKVLQSGNNRCAICGRSAADGVVLHIDHIVPLARGGTSDIENLQVLCQDCNFGKGAL